MSAAQNQGIFKVGDVLNNTYRIEEVLGRGGTSEVYRASSEISGRVVALKALRHEFSRNEDFLALMMREEEMREIRHDAVVRYYDNQRTEDGLVYLIMDYVEGPDLGDKIKDGGMSADDLMIVARRVTEGLVAAHAKKIVHRDLSPDNIILRHGNPADAVIIDFGIAKDTNEGAHTIVGNEFAGKYGYAAPEQLSGQTDARADVYALGALLLATFRGAAPDVGSNPMKMIESKSQPLNTDGVPEPLKTLIEKMTEPSREARLQTAQAVLDQIDGKTSSVADAAPLDLDEPDTDRTVILPLPTVEETPTVAAKTKEAKPKATKEKAPAKSNGGGGKMTLVALVLIAALGAGGYFGGIFDSLLGPSYPRVDPYSFVAQRQAAEAPMVVGHVPSETVRDDIAGLIEELGGHADLTLASGDLPDSWGADMSQLIGMVSVLPEWRVLAEGDNIKITGDTGDATQRAQLTSLFQNDGLPGALLGSVAITYSPPILSVSELTPILEAHANCGALELTDAPSIGYGTEDQVLVLGKVADVQTRVALSDALTAAIGGRDLLLNVEVLNPTMCLVGAALPDLPEGGFGLTFRMGFDGSENTSGRYFVGETPVIDVTIPAHVTTGYLFVSILDVEGLVFTLLPNRYFEDNSIEGLREGRDGAVDVRVAFPRSELADENKLVLRVDDSILGKSQIIALHADDQIFGGVRPTEESAEGFVQALEAVSGTLRSLDSRIMTIAKP